MSDLTIGTLLESESGEPAHVLAKRLNRHTFWCGQSGSGKTYALGVLLEQVLLHTRLPLVVFDPNSDFVRLGEQRADAPAEAAAALRDRDIRVFGPRRERTLHVRMLDMPLRSQAAVADLDPILDAEEYNTMLRIAAEMPDIRQRKLVPYLRASDQAVRHRLAMRFENLGVADWDLWAWGGRSVTDDVDETPDAAIIDPGSRRRPSRARRPSPCSTISGNTARTGSGGSSSSTKRTTCAVRTR